MCSCGNWCIYAECKRRIGYLSVLTEESGAFLDVMLLNLQ